MTHKVKRETLQLTIVERGALESANNHDIVCRVKAGTRGSTAIKSVVDDGTYVHKGQELMRLDSSTLDEQYKIQMIATEKAQNDYIQAKEAVEISRIQGESDRETARVAVELAELDRKKFIEGDYQQQFKDVRSRILVAESDLEMLQDRASYSDRMAKKNFITPSQAQADRARLRSGELALQKVQEELRVLQNYTLVRTLKDLDSKIAEAKRNQLRVFTQTESQRRQAINDRDTKYSIYLQEKSKLDELQEEIDKCTIRAPEEGLVVYYISPQTRFGSGSSQSIIAPGEPVKEGQKLMQIPDLNHMLVNTRVHESLISRVKGERYVRTGFGESLEAALLSTPDVWVRLLGYQGFQAVREDFREMEQHKIYDGQRVKIRVDAFPSKLLDGHVKSAATVAVQQDFSNDVKVYQTMIELEDMIPGLKPGMNAEVTIFTDEHVDNALTVPLQAVVPAGERGKFKCWVVTPNGAEERPVVIGLNNEKMVEIKEGLEEGEEVVINPQALMTEAEKAQALNAFSSGSGKSGGKRPGNKPGNRPGGGKPGAKDAPPSAPPPSGGNKADK